MSITAFFLILSSVILHAVWHFISKKKSPHYAFFLVFSGALFCTMLPFLLSSGINIFTLPFNVWKFIIAGGFFGMLGSVGFSYAYRYSDISQAYPMARALPVMLTLIITQIFNLGEKLNLNSIIGIILIFLGCILLPIKNWQNFNKSDYLNKGIFGILLATIASTGYTIVDGFGIKAMLEFAGEAKRITGAGTYSCLREVVVALGLVIMLILHKEERKYLNKKLFCQSTVYIAGSLAGITYFLILLAMGFVTNVSYVQAFRQMSLPIGVLLGFIILKEQVTYQKILAISMIMLGLLVLYLA